MTMATCEMCNVDGEKLEKQIAALENARDELEDRVDTMDNQICTAVKEMTDWIHELKP